MTDAARDARAQAPGRARRLMRWLCGRLRPHGPMMLAGAIVLATLVLAWAGSRAADELRDRTALVLDQAADQTLTLLFERLMREMSGAHVKYLLSMNSAEVDFDRLHDITGAFAQGLHAYPHIDAFFAWTSDAREADLVVVARSDRHGPLVASRASADAAPVQVTREPALGRWLIATAREHLPFRKGTAVVERTIDGHRYQFVIRLLFQDASRDRLYGITGYAVDLGWARSHYFQSVLDDASAPDAHRLNPVVAMAVVDERGQVVASRGPELPPGTGRTRRFPLLFLDTDLLSITSPRRPVIPELEIRVGIADRSAAAAASRMAAGSQRLLQVAAFTILLSVIWFVQLVQRQSELTRMKAAFVSRVTHELKTPLSLIKLIVETLQLRRVPSPETIDEYYELLSKEATRLERLIDSVLRFSRRDALRGTRVYQPLDVRELVREALARLEPQLHEVGFRVVVSVEEDLPFVLADAAAMEDVLDNLVQNAIKFSPHERVLALTVRQAGGFVEVQLADRGTGIPPEDRPHIFEPFVRGRQVTAAGHGLGLAIVRQIMTEHGGYVRVDSRAGGGSTFTIGLPGAR